MKTQLAMFSFQKNDLSCWYKTIVLLYFIRTLQVNFQSVKMIYKNVNVILSTVCGRPNALRTKCIWMAR